MSKLNEVVSMMGGVGTESSFVDYLVNLYTNYKNSRSKWEEENDEVSKFVFATDTRSTVQQSAMFKNTTTIPKLAQVRNNIITSYEEHLFPTTDWIQWDAATQDAAIKEKADIVKSYVQTKAADSNLKGTAQLLVQESSQEFGEPSSPIPNRQTTRLRHSVRMPEGCAFASMMLEAAPTPCKRTGFHMMTCSW